jgi:hypothetical protein
MSVRVRIENCSPGETIDLTLALSSRGRGSLVAEVDPERPGVALARTRTELAKLLKPSELPLPARREDGSLGAEVWARLLPWAASEAGAVGAFVLDQRGLIVAETPDLPLDRMEELAARLCLVIHGAAALEEQGFQVGAASLELGAWWLTALRVGLQEGEWLAVVLVGEGPASREVRQEIIEEIRLFVVGG